MYSTYVTTTQSHIQHIFNRPWSSHMPPFSQCASSGTGCSVLTLPLSVFLRSIHDVLCLWSCIPCYVSIINMYIYHTLLFNFKWTFVLFSVWGYYKYTTMNEHFVYYLIHRSMHFSWVYASKWNCLVIGYVHTKGQYLLPNCFPRRWYKFRLISAMEGIYHLLYTFHLLGL